jgi:hypothetical protein
MSDEKHLCIPILRSTSEQIGEEMIINAPDWYYARHRAAAMFREKNPDEFRDWCIDSLKLDD